MPQSAGLPRVLADSLDNLGAGIYSRAPKFVKGKVKSFKAQGAMIDRAPEVVAAFGAIGMTFASKAGRFMWPVRLVGSLLVAVGVVGHLVLRVKTPSELLKSALKLIPVDYLDLRSGIKPDEIAGHVVFENGGKQVFRLKVFIGERGITFIEFRLDKEGNVSLYGPEGFPFHLTEGLDEGVESTLSIDRGTSVGPEGAKLYLFKMGESNHLSASVLGSILNTLTQYVTLHEPHTISPYLFHPCLWDLQEIIPVSIYPVIRYYTSWHQLVNSQPTRPQLGKVTIGESNYNYVLVPVKDASIREESNLLIIDTPNGARLFLSSRSTMSIKIVGATYTTSAQAAHEGAAYEGLEGLKGHYYPFFLVLDGKPSEASPWLSGTALVKHALEQGLFPGAPARASTQTSGLGSSRGFCSRFDGEGLSISFKYNDSPTLAGWSGSGGGYPPRGASRESASGGSHHLGLDSTD